MRGEEPFSATPLVEGKDYTCERGVPFLGGQRQEALDLYLPKERVAGKRAPAVVMIHGGGFTGGERGAKREINVCGTLAWRGYVTVSIDYALAGEGRPTWPQNLHDCKTAVRWLRANAERLQVDPERIGVIGGSAGGTLASLVAVTGPESGLDPSGPYGEFSCRVQCGVDLYGIADLTQWHSHNHMFGKPASEAPELYRAASPVSHLDKNDPPMLILHGTADKVVEVRQSELFAEALKQTGVEHELVIIPGAPHTFDLQPKQKDLRPLVVGFFDKHLKR